ncbi:MAG: hypothetical protein AABY22_05455, partial [Nanoarchaeota archaeon]
KSMGTIKTIMNYGGFVSIHFLPSSKAGFPFGFPSGVFHIKKDYKGETLFKELNLKSEGIFPPKPEGMGIQNAKLI